MDTGLIKFFESFENRDMLESKTIKFRVSTYEVYKTIPGMHFFDFSRTYGNTDIRTIELDKEDLNYLYNKYYPKYKEEVIKRDEELKLQKEKEIKLLEDKLNKLKNEK